jgi:hypothetical protein
MLGLILLCWLVQEDMEKVGIGTSVALFGVLISTMW